MIGRTGALADYILTNDKNIIDYHDVVSVLDSHFFAIKNRTLDSVIVIDPI